jgi:flagellar motor switch/type III secretory pathway protein FliN
MLAQQTIPASRDARKAPPMAPDADIPFVPWAHLAVLNALYRRRRALEAMLAGRPVTIATTSPTRGGDDVTDRYVVDLKIDAAAGVICVTRLALDDVMLADLECQPDNAAIAVIADHLVIPVELSPAGIVVTARPLRRRGSSWEWSMGNPTEFSGPTGLQDSDLDDLPVRLVFEVGRVELSLGELQRLAPGALVPLARPLDEPIDIMANGRRLGRGTLVRIGESLGVRIVSLVGNE